VYIVYYIRLSILRYVRYILAHF